MSRKPCLRVAVALGVWVICMWRPCVVARCVFEVRVIYIRRPFMVIARAIASVTSDVTGLQCGGKIAVLRGKFNSVDASPLPQLFKESLQFLRVGLPVIPLSWTSPIPLLTSALSSVVWDSSVGCLKILGYSAGGGCPKPAGCWSSSVVRDPVTVGKLLFVPRCPLLSKSGTSTIFRPFLLNLPKNDFLNKVIAWLDMPEYFSFLRGIPYRTLSNSFEKSKITIMVTLRLSICS